MSGSVVAPVGGIQLAYSYAILSRVAATCDDVDLINDMNINHDTAIADLRLIILLHHRGGVMRARDSATCAHCYL